MWRVCVCVFARTLLATHATARTIPATGLQYWGLPTLDHAVNVPDTHCGVRLHYTQLLPVQVLEVIRQPHKSGDECRVGGGGEGRRGGGRRALVKHRGGGVWGEGPVPQPQHEAPCVYTTHLFCGELPSSYLANIPPASQIDARNGGRGGGGSGGVVVVVVVGGGGQQNAHSRTHTPRTQSHSAAHPHTPHIHPSKPLPPTLLQRMQCPVLHAA
jgi:hypothetical protein